MKVALEAAMAVDSVTDIAGQVPDHRQVIDWRKRLLENTELVFEKRVKQEEQAELKIF